MFLSQTPHFRHHPVFGSSTRHQKRRCQIATAASLVVAPAAANHLAVLPEDLAEIALTVSTIATALETPTGAVGASRAAGHFCQHTKGDLMEHIQASYVNNSRCQHV